MSEIFSGNANVDGQETRQWLVGAFMPEGDIRNTKQVEIKWGNHHKGDRREEWATDEARTTVAMLIAGKFALEFPDKKIELSQQGDYAMWGPGAVHRWEALEDSVFLTIRWESTSDVT